MDECIASLLIFSGRPDPTWKIEEATIKELQNIWNSLVTNHGELLSSPSLSYRGCLIKCCDGIEWFVFKNIVSLTISGKTESRADYDKKLESLILASAPQDIVPPSLLKIIHEQSNKSEI